jgi:hypothetical protein
MLLDDGKESWVEGRWGGCSYTCPLRGELLPEMIAILVEIFFSPVSGGYGLEWGL